MPGWFVGWLVDCFLFNFVSLL